MVSKQALSIIVVFTVIALVNCQFFSTNDGINLPRIGKRSYLSTLLRRKPYTLGNNKASAIDDYRHIDKLSYRKWLGDKYGKRDALDDEDNDGGEANIDTAEFITADNVDISRQMMIDEALAKFLAYKLNEQNSSESN
jgi:hypothetical protein